MVRKRWRSVWKAGGLSAFFGCCGRKARNDIVFRNKVLSIQKLKFSFLNLLGIKWSNDPSSFF